MDSGDDNETTLIREIYDEVDKSEGAVNLSRVIIVTNVNLLVFEDHETKVINVMLSFNY